ncbi:hypothetical protein T265_00935 [Opisthorchis viverrini]|uniref:PAN domain protein n=1 Tax=Opisthorchis viverrini TaxID=6198 RepID=A0A075A1M9_OPIVI|nr:hypothetical protein T265_00935 [Opisthorchis viverrini]KER33251.1 hypothetical protein T265_00935 [Opisthorchis viverrini]
MREPMILLYVAFLQAIMRAHSQCPSPYNEVSPGLCVVRLASANSFCAACEMCAKYGAARGQLAFVLGRNANRVFPNDSETGHTWLGFNKFLTEPTQRAVGWRDVDPRTPGFMTNGPEMQLAVAEPQANSTVVVTHGNGKMYDCPSDCYELGLAVYCEYGGVLPTGLLLQQYRSDFPVSLTEVISSQTHGYGCFAEANSTSIIDCGRKCTLNVACRSLYYGNSSGRCVHATYADSLLPANIASGELNWKRFAKVSYPQVANELFPWN